MLILGGAGRLYGGLIGAIIFMIARDWFSGVNPQYWYLPIGVLLIAVVLFLPNGILGGVSQLVNTERGPALVRLAHLAATVEARRMSTPPVAFRPAASTSASARWWSPTRSASRCRRACATR